MDTDEEETSSNGHPEHIIPNCIVSTQAEGKFKSKKSSFLEQQSKIGKFDTNLPQFPDTVTPCELLDNELYQAHLETISDFLLCGKGVWWHVNDNGKKIVFHDGKEWPEFQEQGPPLCTTFVLLPLRVKAAILRQSAKSALTMGASIYL